MTLTELIDQAVARGLDPDETKLHLCNPWGEIREASTSSKADLVDGDPAIAEWPEGPALVLEAEQL